ncbi:hypothetical protein HFP72_18735 [Nocardiopsis sp. ARC36]
MVSTRPARQGDPGLAEALSAHLGIELTPREFTLPDGTRIGVDCADGGRPSLLVQFTPLQGPVKSTQRNKVIADAFKLVWLRDHHFPDAHVLLVIGEPLARLFGRGPGSPPRSPPTGSPSPWSTSITGSAHSISVRDEHFITC